MLCSSTFTLDALDDPLTDDDLIDAVNDRARLLDGFDQRRGPSRRLRR